MSYTLDYRRIFVVCGLFLLVGCSSMHIETQHADDVDFSRYKTWNWLPEPVTPDTDPRLADPMVKMRIRRAIEKEFLTQGFRKDTTSPDFIVNYHAALKDQLSQSAVDNSYDTAMYDRYDQNWTYQYTSEWQEGTLIIDILDSRTKELVWRGSAQAEIAMTASDEERDKRVEEAVRKMTSLPARRLGFTPN